MALVKVKDNQTGQIIQVDSSQLGNYGIQAPGTSQAMPTAPSTQGLPTGQPKAPVTSPAPSFDWSNQKAVEQRRQAAISTGVAPAVVDKYIADQTTNYATQQLAQSGKLDYGNYTNIVKTNPKLALKIAQSGFAPSAPLNASAQKAQDTKTAAKDLATFDSGVADQIYQSWGKMSPLEKVLSTVPYSEKAAALVPNHANIESLFYGNLIGGLKQQIGGRVTQQEIQWMHDNELPGPGDSQQTAQKKIENLKQSFNKKLSNPNQSIVPDSNTSASTKYKIIEVK